MPFTESELASLFMDVRRPFLGPEGRDAVWDRRRSVRHRTKKAWLPKNINVKQADVYFRDLLPNFAINRITQSLGANNFRYALKVPGMAGPALRRKGENLEDWIRGAWDMCDPQGALDGRVREQQAADGLGCYEIEAREHFIAPKRGEAMSDTDYSDLIDMQRESYGLPFRVLAPDTRGMYYTLEDDPELVIKVVNRPLVAVRDNWNTGSDGKQLKAVLAEDGKTGRIGVVTGAAMSPAVSAADFGQMVRLVRISHREFIYDCCYVQTAPAGIYGGTVFGDDGAPGTKPDLILLGSYKNPFNKPPYFFATARRTTDPNPAYSDYPLAVELLEHAEYKNQMFTAWMSRAMQELLHPIQYQPPPQEYNTPEDANPKRADDLLQPGVIEAPGEFKQIALPPIAAFEQLNGAFDKIEGAYNTGLMSMLSSGALGRSAPAWTTLQMNEEKNAFIKEALDSRSAARRGASLMMVGFAKERAKTGPIYVRTTRRSRKNPERNDDEVKGLSYDDFNIPFRLEVTLDAQTQSQRAALVEYGRRLKEEGSISEETYYEQYVGIDDIEQEQARKDREAVQAPMRKAAILAAQQKAVNEWVQVAGPDVLPIAAAVGLPAPTQQPQPAAPMGAPPPPGAAAPAPMSGEPGELAAGPGSPGQGMGLTVPEPAQDLQTFGNQGPMGSAG